MTSPCRPHYTHQITDSSVLDDRTAFYALGLIASTQGGVLKLAEYGWHCCATTRSEEWPVVSEHMVYADIEMTRESRSESQDSASSTRSAIPRSSVSPTQFPIFAVHKPFSALCGSSCYTSPPTRLCPHCMVPPAHILPTSLPIHTPSVPIHSSLPIPSSPNTSPPPLTAPTQHPPEHLSPMPHLACRYTPQLIFSPVTSPSPFA